MEGKYKRDNMDTNGIHWGLLHEQVTGNNRGKIRK